MKLQHKSSEVLMCCDDIESGFEYRPGDLFNRKRLVRRVGAWNDSPAERTAAKSAETRQEAR